MYNSSDESEDDIDRNSETSENSDSLPEQVLASASIEPIDTQFQLLSTEEHPFSIREYAASSSPSSAPTPPSMSRVSLKDFELKAVIGQGAYGKVFLVQSRKHSDQKKFYAMKVLRKATLVIHAKDTEHTWNERKILEDVAHPFIVKLFYAFHTSFKLYLILGYAPGGELFSHLSRSKHFPESTVIFYSSELLLALQHLHSLGIIYRDLKPENVLLGSDGHILLTDFGLSKVSLDGARTICGTTEFLAPEIILLDQFNENAKIKPTTNPPPTYTHLVDYWSLGIMIYDMLTGHPPFTGSNNKKVMDSIIKKKLVCPNYMTAAAKDLCVKLLKKHPSVRLGSTPLTIRSHTFYRSIKWNLVLQKHYTPPIIPGCSSSSSNNGDQQSRDDPLSSTENFDEQFTSLPVHDTPPEDKGGVCKCTTAVESAACGAMECLEDPFLGFSYVRDDEGRQDVGFRDGFDV